MKTSTTTQNELSLFGVTPGVAKWLLFAPPPEPDWLIDRLIHRGIIAMLDGLGSSGKSLLALQLAISVATGNKFLDQWQCKQGRVIYINAEDPDSQSHVRFRRMAEGLTAAQLSALETNLTVVSMCDIDSVTPMMYYNRGTTSTYIKIKEFCNAWQPDLLILDPLAFFAPTAESSNDEAVAFYLLLKQLKTTVLLLHHQSKSAMNGEAAQRAKSRGASALTENAKTRLSLEDGHLICDKNNYGNEFKASMTFDSKSFNWRITSLSEGTTKKGKKEVF